MKSGVCDWLVDMGVVTGRYVTGNRRETLGKMEEEWGVLMFFLDSYKDDPERHKRVMEKLAIFGPMRNRRGAELKVMSAVEAKQPGQFTRGMREKESRSKWGTDTLMMSDTELAYGLGANGSTRRKLARSAGECERERDPPPPTHTHTHRRIRCVRPMYFGTAMPHIRADSVWRPGVVGGHTTPYMTSRPKHLCCP